MTDIRKAAQQALEALTYYRDECSGAEPSISLFHQKLEGAVASLQAALSQPAEGQEPLFLLYTGQIDSSGEQDEWETEADSWNRVEAFCRANPGKTIGLYPAAQPVQVPEGWRLVPVEPTPEMLDAVVSTMDDLLLGKHAEQQYRDDWSAMLAAAPLPPAQPQEPVNRRLLDALKELMSDEAPEDAMRWADACDEARSAIAEAEAQQAAQPVDPEPLSRQTLIGLWGDKSDGPSNSEIVDFGRAVERAHGITGEGV